MTATSPVVYLLQCADGSLYCGWTTNLARRVDQHNGVLPGGAKYTRARRPVTVAATFPADDQAAAQREEARIKRMSRRQKQQLIAQHAAAMSSNDDTLRS